MRRSALKAAAVMLAASLCAFAGRSGSAGDAPSARASLKMSADEDFNQIPVVSGEFVHNVGDLQMNITNWGVIGSMPQSNYDMGDVPSAQYPAGSGVEYLYAAGLWVGAVRNGIPSVSTAYPEDEFRPVDDPRGMIRITYEGAAGGTRLPGAADDDGDGKIDEELLNGLDDDNDGLVDEDFAAIGNQMFTSEYDDFQPESELIWPEHRPLGIRVRQESFQWGEDMYNDIIGMRFTVTNRTFDFLRDVYLGVYADLDAGPRDRGTYQMDDKVGYWSGKWCAPKGSSEFPVWMKLAYVHDDDGDDGRAEAYFGILLLGYTTTVNGNDVPRYPSYRINSFKHFQGLLPYVNGGDPGNDFERYEVMSEQEIDGDTDKPGDYRVLLTTGKFSYISPGSSIYLDVAFVAGNGLEDMLDHAAIARRMYDGIMYDLDGNSNTGKRRRESPVNGPLDNYDPDRCDGIDEFVKVPKGEVCWSNLDCLEELQTYNDRECYRQDVGALDDYATGVDGKESRLHWVTECAPSPPRMRVVPGHGCVAVLWDDLSEVTPDPFSLKRDFEGYMVWRADDWHRPLGTNERTGPSQELWTLLEVRDVTNGVLPDNEFRMPEYNGGWIYTPMKYMDWDVLSGYRQIIRSHLLVHPDEPAPCPAGLEPEECDTLEAIVRYSLGLEGGRRYYRYVDDTAVDGMHYFYSVVAEDHNFFNGEPIEPGRYNSPSSNFVYAVSSSEAVEVDDYGPREVYVVPNPVTSESMAPWELGPTNDDASGLKLEFRNLPCCRSVIRVYTVSGDLVQTIEHDGSGGDGTAPWNLVSRNGQDITSGVYIFSVEPSSGRFERAIGRFVVIR